MRFGRLEAADSINIAALWTGKSQILKEEPRTWKAERENFVPLPLKCQ